MADASESQLLHVLSGSPASVIVAPIGGQGFIFGRGNLQISPAVLSRIPPSAVLVVATPTKLAGLRGGPFRVDTGDREIDRRLSGYLPVVTGYRERTFYRVVGR